MKLSIFHNTRVAGGSAYPVACFQYPQIRQGCEYSGREPITSPGTTSVTRRLQPKVSFKLGAMYLEWTVGRMETSYNGTLPLYALYPGSDPYT
jgi:hypothetical protein